MILHPDTITLMLKELLGSDTENTIQFHKNMRRPSIIDGRTYCPADHSYLIQKDSEAYGHRFVDVIYSEHDDDTIDVTTSLTPKGARALEVSKFYGFWDTTTDDFALEETLADYRRLLSQSSISKKWVDTVMARQFDWLKPIHEEIILEIFKRTLDNTQYITKDHQFWL